MKWFLLLSSFFYCGAFRVSAQSIELQQLKSALAAEADSMRQIDMMNRIAILYYEFNADSTFNYAIQARDIANRLDYRKGKADASNNLGVFFNIKGNSQLALRYYDQAYKIYADLDDLENRVQTQMNIAMVYFDLKKNDRSQQRFDIALQEGEKLVKDSILSLVLFNYLLIFPENFSEVTTKHYLSKIKRIATNYDDQRVLIGLKQLEANQLISTGERAHGLLMLDSAINLAEESKLYYAMMDMLIGMGDYLLAENPQRAIIYYEKGAKIAKEQKFLIYSRSIARKLYEFYSDKNNYEIATHYAKELLSFDDLQRELDNSSGIDYLDYVLKEEQLISLKNRTEDHNKLLFLAGIVTLLTIILLFLVRRNLLSTRKFNEKLLLKNEELHNTLSVLQHAYEDNAQLIKTVAHDLRNPMGGIYSMVDVMIGEDHRSVQDRQILEMIREASSNSLKLVEDLLQMQFSIDAVNKESVELDMMLKHCVNMLQPKAEVKNQALELESNPIKVPASRDRLWRVVSNLISNAIKFSPESSRIAIKAESFANKVRISVSDQGIGIPNELKTNIFDLFSSSSRKGTAGEESYGLGLAISKKIVEAHHGKIWFDSNIPKGTIFFVELPLN